MQGVHICRCPDVLRAQWLLVVVHCVCEAVLLLLGVLLPIVPIGAAVPVAVLMLLLLVLRGVEA